MQTHEKALFYLQISGHYQISIYQFLTFQRYLAEEHSI